MRVFPDAVGPMVSWLRVEAVPGVRRALVAYGGRRCSGSPPTPPSDARLAALRRRLSSFEKLYATVAGVRAVTRVLQRCSPISAAPNVDGRMSGSRRRRGTRSRAGIVWYDVLTRRTPPPGCRCCTTKIAEVPQKWGCHEARDWVGDPGCDDGTAEAGTLDRATPGSEHVSRVELSPRRPTAAGCQLTLRLHTAYGRCASARTACDHGGVDAGATHGRHPYAAVIRTQGAVSDPLSRYPTAVPATLSMASLRSPTTPQWSALTVTGQRRIVFTPPVADRSPTWGAPLPPAPPVRRRRWEEVTDVAALVAPERCAGGARVPLR